MADRLFKAAARAGTAANFREVLKKCAAAEVKFRGEQDQTVLMEMVDCHGSQPDWHELFAAVIKKGCDVNAKDQHGRFALFLMANVDSEATQPHRNETARILLENGADRTMTSDGGKTAAQLARHHGKRSPGLIDFAKTIEDWRPGAPAASATSGMASLSVSSPSAPPERFDFFISHCTKDDSLNVFEKVSTYMDAKEKKIFNPTTHLSHVKQINKAAMQGAVKRSKIVVAALSDGFFTSDWCAAEIVAAKQAGIKVIPVFSGNDHAANQVDKWVKAYKDHPDFGYVFRENARDVLNKQNPASTKATLKYLSELA